jgi:hypothetical protein
MWNKSVDVPTETFNIGIDSEFRDKQKYPNPHTYTVAFDNVFKNVVSVELVLAMYGKFTIDQYINLCIEELSPNLESNSNYVRGSFTQLPLLDNLNRYDRGMYESVKVFEKPIAKLHKFTIRFITPSGQDYPIREHFLRFQVTCMRSQAINEWKNLEVISKSIPVFSSGMFNPKEVLGLPEVYSDEMLTKAFKEKARLYKGYDAVRYDECKRALKMLLEKQGTS